MGSNILAFDVDVGKYIYWTKEVFDVGDEKYVFGRYTWPKGGPNKPLGNANITHVGRRCEVTDLVVDSHTGNLYTIDDDNGRILLTDARGPPHLTLNKGLVKPRKIVLDPEEGLMFVLQQSHSIVRANMDGRQLTEIVKSNVTALAIDSYRERLYWVNNNFSIESSDYEGKDQKSLFVDTVKIETLAVLDDRLFWTWTTFGNTTNLFSCEIDKNCVEHSTYNVPANVTSIQGYTSEKNKVVKPCDFDDIGCERFCLISGRNESNCACSDGWLLSSDGRRCL